MHRFPVLFLFWGLSVTAFPFLYEDDQEPPEVNEETIIHQHTDFCRHLDPDILQVNKLQHGLTKVAGNGTVTGGLVWKHKNLTYRIENYGRSLSPDDVVSAIKRAFKLWSDVTPLTFTRVYNKGDIELKFVTGDHNDNNEFQTNTTFLAHAFPPGPNDGGDVHFNDAKNFTKTSKPYNLFLVAAHEIGHSLGLQHSNGQIDLMNPQYLMTDPKGFRLSQNDINAIQHLYGPSPKNPFVKGPSICDPGQDYDAATTVRGDVFFFTDRYVLRRYHNSSEVQMDFIQTYWNFLPNNINAAYENTDSDIVRVFQGIKYWEITEGLNLTSMGSIYHFGFPSHVKFIDAAVFVENNEKTYFFVRKKYWRYNEKTQAMDEGFPRSIAKDFPGVGPRINAAMYFKEKLYLLDNNAQHEISINESGQIAEKIYKSPKSHWVGC